MIASPPHYLHLEFTNASTKGEEHKRTLPFANSPLFHAKIKSAKVLAQGPDVKTIYDIALDLQNIVHDFKPGDAIGILPLNDEREVDQILKRLNLQEKADDAYTLSILEGTLKKKATLPPHLPTCGTLRNVFLEHLNIRSVPKKLFLKSLLEYTDEEEDKTKITNLCDPKQTALYNDFVSQEGGTLLGLLLSLPSCNPPMERILEHLPALLPRYYSIASSPLMKEELHITFSVLDFGDFKGVCTGWLERCVHSETAVVDFYFRKPSGFLHISDVHKPIIMVGPGTGVGPFVGFLQDRLLKQEKDGKCVLYYGCRYSDRDHIYKDETDEFVRQGVLAKLVVTYSRESVEKVYVQTKILEDGLEIADTILNGGTVCVCGDAKNMVKDVEAAILTCLMKFGNMDQGDAASLIKEMQNNGKYQVDNWI